MCFLLQVKGFPGGSEVKVSAWNAGDPGSIPRLGRSPGEGNGNPLQYSFLESPMEGGAWQATIHGVAKSQTRLSDLKKKKLIKGFPGGTSGNCLPMQETKEMQVRSLGGEYPLEEGWQPTLGFLPGKSP